MHLLEDGVEVKGYTKDIKKIEVTTSTNLASPTTRLQIEFLKL